MLKLTEGMCVLALASSGLMAQSVSSSTPAPAEATTGIIAVAQEQFAQFNVLNPGVQPPAVGVVCNALLTFLGDNGGVLKTKMVTVAPGQSGAIQLHSAADLGLAVGQRKEVRATVSIPPVVPVAGGAAVAAPCNLIGTLEIVSELTGATEVVLGGLHAVPNPPVAGN